MNCPKCDGPMWDNRTDKKTPKSPDYKCKDKGCGHPIWLEKKASAPKGQSNGQATHGKWTWLSLQETYRKSLLIASKQVKALVPNATPGDVVAATATVFIAASRDGIQSEPQQSSEDDGLDGIPF